MVAHPAEETRRFRTATKTYNEVRPEYFRGIVRGVTYSRCPTSIAFASVFNCRQSSSRVGLRSACIHRRLATPESVQCVCSTGRNSLAGLARTENTWPYPGDDSLADLNEPSFRPGPGTDRRARPSHFQDPPGSNTPPVSTAAPGGSTGSNRSESNAENFISDFKVRKRPTRWHLCRLMRACTA
jgi:hypothetical protein